jgi:hypothetical protein
MNVRLIAIEIIYASNDGKGLKSSSVGEKRRILVGLFSAKVLAHNLERRISPFSDSLFEVGYWSAKNCYHPFWSWITGENDSSRDQTPFDAIADGFDRVKRRWLTFRDQESWNNPDLLGGRAADVFNFEIDPNKNLFFLNFEFLNRDSLELDPRSLIYTHFEQLALKYEGRDNGRSSGGECEYSGRSGKYDRYVFALLLGYTATRGC